MSLKLPAVAEKFPVVRLAEQLHPPTRVGLPQGLPPCLGELGVLRRKGNASREERGSPEIFLELVGGEPRQFLDGACSVGVFSQSRQDLGEVPVGMHVGRPGTEGFWGLAARAACWCPMAWLRAW